MMVLNERHLDADKGKRTSYTSSTPYILADAIRNSLLFRSPIFQIHLSTHNNRKIVYPLPPQRKPAIEREHHTSLATRLDAHVSNSSHISL
jgi:hypothetical protein